MSTAQLDLVTSANLLVAAGTFALALVTLLMVREARKQFGIFFKIFSMFRSQQEPFLVLRDFKFQDNRLTLTVENQGAGNARLLGVVSSFYPVRPFYHADEAGKVEISDTEAQTRDKKGEHVYVRFHMDWQRKLAYSDWKGAASIGGGTFLYNKLTGNAILLPHETQEFTIEPFFEIWEGERRKKTGNRGKFMLFSELQQFLIANRIQFVGLDFDLTCKDSLDRVVDSLTIRRFVMNLSIHSTLEDGYLKGFGFSDFTLSERELAKDIGYFDGEDYRRTKRPRNVPGAEGEWD